MSEKSLFEFANEVEDEESFLKFIDQLVKDRILYISNRTKDEWQNETIEDFFERAHSWGEDSISGLKYYNKPDNPWKGCAQIIYMGKIYE